MIIYLTKFLQNITQIYDLIMDATFIFHSIITSLTLIKYSLNFLYFIFLLEVKSLSHFPLPYKNYHQIHLLDLAKEIICLPPQKIIFKNVKDFFLFHERKSKSIRNWKNPLSLLLLYLNKSIFLHFIICHEPIILFLAYLLSFTSKSYIFLFRAFNQALKKDLKSFIENLRFNLFLGLN